METQTYIRLKNKPQDNYPEFIVLHHSAATEDQTVQSIENYHLSLGWEGVGYQYLINKAGQVWKGRPELYHGAHVSEQGMNKKSIGICVIGDFDKKLPTNAQVVSLTTLLKDIITRYPKIQIKYHRDFNPKSCPGKNIPNDWAVNLLKVAEEDTVKVPRRLILEISKYL
jgi:N-acetyl-anhydromuramyl-L-alanine amidase AmpD